MERESCNGLLLYFASNQICSSSILCSLPIDCPMKTAIKLLLISLLCMSMAAKSCVTTVVKNGSDDAARAADDVIRQSEKNILAHEVDQALMHSDDALRNALKASSNKIKFTDELFAELKAIRKEFSGEFRDDLMDFLEEYVKGVIEDYVESKVEDYQKRKFMEAVNDEMLNDENIVVLRRVLKKVFEPDKPLPDEQIQRIIINGSDSQYSLSSKQRLKLYLFISDLFADKYTAGLLERYSCHPKVVENFDRFRISRNLPQNGFLAKGIEDCREKLR